MKKIILLVLVSTCICISVSGQYLNLFDIDFSSYPTVTAKLQILDETGNIVDNPDKKDLFLYENKNLITNPQITPPAIISAQTPLSIVFTVDISGTMKGERLDILKEELYNFIGQVPLNISECAITSFDHKAYINQDFTRNYDYLETAIEALEPKGGTDYNEAFSDDKFGAFKLAKTGLHKKIVVFITDGFGFANENEIIQQANDNDITVYCITLGMKTPAVLQNISVKTNGKYFENITDLSLLNSNLTEILQREQNTNLIDISWVSNYSCEKNMELALVYKNKTYNINYTLPDDKILNLKTNLEQINFGNIEINSNIEKVVSLTAHNSDFTISDIIVTNKYYFEVISKEVPFTIKNGETEDLVIRYNAKDSAFVFSNFIVTTDKCDNVYLYADGGYLGVVSLNNPENSLKVKFPNGGEEFPAGLDTTILWEGIKKDTRIILSYSNDNGQSWTQLADTSGLKVKLTMPFDVGTNFKLKATQVYNNNLLNSITTTSGTIKEFGFSPQNTYIYSLSETKKLTVYNGVTTKELYTLDNVEHVAFSPNDDLLITAETDNAIKLYDIQTASLLQTLTGHTSNIENIEYHKTESKLLSTSSDNYTILWNTETGDTMRTFNKVLYSTFSNDGKSVISAYQEKEAIFKFFILLDDFKIGDKSAASYSEIYEKLKIHKLNLQVLYSNEKLIVSDKLSSFKLTLESKTKVEYPNLLQTAQFTRFNNDSTAMLVLDDKYEPYYVYLNYTYLQKFDIEKQKAVVTSHENIQVAGGIKNINPSSDDLRTFVIDKKGKFWIWYVEKNNLIENINTVNFEYGFNKKINSVRPNYNFISSVNIEPKKGGNIIFEDADNKCFKANVFVAPVGGEIIVPEPTLLYSNAKFSNDGNKIYYIKDNSIEVTDASGKTVFFEISDEKSNFKNFSFNSDASKIITLDSLNNMKIWKASQEVYTLQPFEDKLDKIDAFFIDKNRRIFTTNTEQAKIYDSYTGDLIYEFIPAGKQKIYDIDVKTDTSLILIADDSKIVIKDYMYENKSDTIFLEGRKIVKANFLNDSSLILIAFENEFKIIDYKTKIELLKQKTKDKIQNVLFTDCKKYFAVFLSEKTLFYNSQTLKKIFTTKDLVSDKTKIAVNPASEYIASFSGRNFYAWNLKSGKRILFSEEDKTISNFDFSYDNTYVAIACSKYIYVDKITTSKKGKLYLSQKEIIKAHKNETVSIDYRIDNEQLLSVSDDKTCKVWEPLNGNLKKEYIGHSDKLLLTEFSDDGTRFISGSKDGTIKLWVVPDIQGTIEDISDTTFTVFSAVPLVRDVVISYPLFNEQNYATDTIFNYNPFPCAITDIDIEGKEAKYFVLKTDTQFVMLPKSYRIIEYEFNPKSSSKQCSNQASIKFRLPGDSIISRSISGNVTAPLIYIPENINIGNSKPYEPITKDTIFFVNKTKKYLRLKAEIQDTTQFKIVGTYTDLTSALIGKGEIKIMYTPKKRGTSSTSLKITVEGYEDDPYYITIYGYCDSPREITASGSVFDMKSYDSSLKIYCKDAISGTMVEPNNNENTGKYSFNLFSERKYILYSEKDTTYLDLTDFKNMPKEENLVRSIFLFDLQKDLNLCIKNITFISGNSDLEAISYKELDRIFNILNENSNIKVLICGHTDNTSDYEANMVLSIERATIVQDYLLKKGISADRIEIKGFGDTLPIESNDTEEGRKANRRVEIIISEF